MLAAVSVSTTSALIVFLVGALSVQIRRDLRFGTAGLGLAVATPLMTAALTSAAAGRLIERIGPGRGMRLATVLCACSLGGIAVAGTSFGVLLAFLVVGGVGGAIAQPGSNLLIARAVTAERQGTAFGIKQSAIPAAMLLGGLAVPTIGLTVGWRWAFAGAALLALVALTTVPGVDPPPPQVPESPPPRRGALVGLAVAGGLGAAPANTLGAFLVASAVEAGMAEGSAGLLFAVSAAAGLAVRVAGGMLVDHRGVRDAFPAVSVMLAGGAVGFALLARGEATLLVPGALLAYTMGWGWPGLFNFSVVARFPEAPAAATGITQTGVFAGALAGPLAFGFLAARFGFPTAWTFSLVTTLGAAAGVWAAAGRRRPAGVVRPLAVGSRPR